ncbi:MAG: hypothetical protein ABFD08_05940 [Syntrophomonas sp.]
MPTTGVPLGTFDLKIKVVKLLKEGSLILLVMQLRIFIAMTTVTLNAIR